MFCKNCGKQLDDKQKFCDACGAPVSGEKTSHGNVNGPRQPYLKMLRTLSRQTANRADRVQQDSTISQ